MRTWTLLTLLVATGLAGCAEEGLPQPVDDADFSDLDLQATSDTGVLRGVVVDPSVTPVADALVSLNDGTQTQTTADGTFGFAELEPGTYFLTVSKPGWTEVQQSTSVVAGLDNPPVVRVQIAQVPGLLPRFEVQQQSGFIACGAATYVSVHPLCNQVGLNDDQSYLAFDFTGTPDWFQTELVWDSTQPLGDNLYEINYVHDGQGEFTGDRIGEGFGESPMVYGFDRTATEAVGLGANGVTVGVFSGGPVLETGVALDQRFDVYVSTFYNFQPAEGYVFITDGAPDVPA